MISKHGIFSLISRLGGTPGYEIQRVSEFREVPPICQLAVLLVSSGSSPQLAVLRVQHQFVNILLTPDNRFVKSPASHVQAP
jgi:hypothetical protein